VAVEPFSRFFEPLRKSIVVDCDPAHAFDTFTARMSAWWPLAAGYSMFGARAVSCGIEPRAGGEVYELRDDGERCVWGKVLEWAPPERLVLSWHPGLPSGEAQEVEIRFTGVPAGTRVDLEHRHWHQLGDRAPGVRESYDSGWASVLARFSAHAHGPEGRTP
jgi:uncharacterized protein YndB with AHSA1/START domain